MNIPAFRVSILDRREDGYEICIQAFRALLGLAIMLVAGSLADRHARDKRRRRHRHPSSRRRNAGQNSAQQPNYAISITVPVVNVDVVVTDNDGNYLTGLKKENFRLTEDGAPQTITNFSTADAPITVVMLVEYSRRAYGWYLYTARSWADVFLHQLKPSDWVALESFAMRPNVEVDFTHNMSEVEQGLINLVLPTFSEAVIYDALLDTIDRMQDVKGKKSMLVLASGEDTFSRHTLMIPWRG